MKNVNKDYKMSTKQAKTFYLPPLLITSKLRILRKIFTIDMHEGKTVRFCKIHCHTDRDVMSTKYCTSETEVMNCIAIIYLSLFVLI